MSGLTWTPGLRTAWGLSPTTPTTWSDPTSTTLTSEPVTTSISGLGLIEGDSFHGSKLSTEHISQAKNWLD